MKKILLILIIHLIASLSLIAGDKQFYISKASQWVKAIEYDKNFHLYENNQDNGGTYLLLDYQTDVASEEFYAHTVIKIDEKAGIASYSDIWINYDPSYQRLIFHKLVLHRNGKTINKLKRKDFKIVQNETDLERKIYSGDYSAGIFLEDVQVGDIIEYAYTIKGRNPVLKGNYFSSFNLEYSVPINKLYLQINYPKARHINYKLIESKHTPKKVINGSQVNLTWELDNVAEVLSNTNTPKWFIAYGQVQFSEFTTWEELRQWSQVLYPKIDIKNSKLDRKIQDLTKGLNSAHEKVNAVIRFVQDDIRYVGIEVNVNSHKPHHPIETFKKRFGDCKDKSYLLVTMLNHLGVNAWVSYVHTDLKYKISDYLPSPYIFNHVVVAIFHINELNFIDPTLSNQGGDYTKSYFVDNTKAFIISDFYKEPYFISSGSTEKIIINEKYEILDSIAPVKYTVNSTYYGGEADAMRASFESQTKKEFESTYLNFYSYLYPQMRIDEDIKFEDDKKENTVKVDESYLIDNFWTFNDSPEVNDYVSVINSTNLKYFLNAPEQRNRKTPFGIYHPIEIVNTIEIKNERVFIISDEKGEINNPCFNFSYSITYEGKNATIEYKFKTLKDFVSVEELNQYYTDIDAVSNIIWKEYTYGNNEEDGHFNWLLFILMFFFTIIIVYFAVRLYQRDIEVVDFDKALPFGGWLILPVIGVALSPFTLAYSFYIGEYFDATTLEFISSTESDGYNLVWTIAYVFELLMNCVLIVYSIFLLILLIKKRTIFPIHFISFELMFFGTMLISAILISQIDSIYLDQEAIKSNSTEVFRAFIGACIWIPYMLKSERVKKTFLNKRNEENN